MMHMDMDVPDQSEESERTSEEILRNLKSPAFLYGHSLDSSFAEVIEPAIVYDLQPMRIHIVDNLNHAMSKTNPTMVESKDKNNNSDDVANHQQQQ